ncbi:ATP-binding protein [Halobacillus sp. MO56]
MHKNDFVYYLDQYNVLSPNHSKIYDEYTNDENTVNYNFTIETKVENYLLNVFSNEPRSIILTGNAGDGKTRLCRTVYNHFSEEELKSWPTDGLIEINFPHGKLIFVKDLSELKDEVIEDILTNLQNQMISNYEDPTYYLIAANEGKLNKFLSQRNSLGRLYKEVKNRFNDYKNNNFELDVINLLDVTSSEYVRRVLDDWNSDENWESCAVCPMKDKCIIFHNHTKTSQQHIKDQISSQYRTLDFLNEHITMREMLIHIAYTITGGYVCEDIFTSDSEEINQQRLSAYYDNFYGAHARQDAFDEMRALKVLKILDPGKYSHSVIDDFIVNGDISGDDYLENSHNKLFSNQLDMKFNYFVNQLHTYRYHDEIDNKTFIEEWISKLRRKTFFELEKNDLFDVKELLAFEYLPEYFEVFENKEISSGIKNKLIAGLNRTFSKKLISPKQKHLLATSENALVSGEYNKKYISIELEKTRNDIDHLPSKLNLNVELKEDDVPLEINLLVFEYLMRIAGGGTHNILRQDVEILLDTFKNELINSSDPEEDELEILRLDKEAGLYIVDAISFE